MQAEIYAIDEPDSTVYVLIRSGEKPVMADWPQPLRELCPEAVMAGTLGGEDWQVANVVPPKHTVGGDGFALGLTVQSERRSRKTGTVVRTWRNFSYAWPNMNGNRWVTECVDHQEAAGHTWIRDAVLAMARSDEWCDKCESLVWVIERIQVRGDTSASEVLAKLESLYGGHKER